MSTPSPQVSFDDEPLILVDAKDTVVGHLDKAACHTGQGILHRAFSVFLFDHDGAVLLQQRSAQKRLWPLFWANTCCSHPRRGETVTAAANRRLAEELGAHSTLTFTYKFIYHAPYGDAGAEHELCWVFIGRLHAPPKVNPREIAATERVAPDVLDQALATHPDRYTPWLIMEWQALRQTHWAQVQAL